MLANRMGAVATGRNSNRTIALLRKASTQATEVYGIGGRPKKRPRPKPTLPKLRCLRPVIDEEEEAGSRR